MDLSFSKLQETISLQTSLERRHIVKIWKTQCRIGEWKSANNDIIKESQFFSNIADLSPIVVLLSTAQYLDISVWEQAKCITMRSLRYIQVPFGQCAYMVTCANALQHSTVATYLTCVWCRSKVKFKVTLRLFNSILKLVHVIQPWRYAVGQWSISLYLQSPLPDSCPLLW